LPIPPVLRSFIFKEFSIKKAVILAIGAAGKFAGLVVPALALRGGHVRAFIKDAKQEGTVRAKGALRTGGPLNKPGPSTFYGEGPEGYTDYPARPLVNAAA
jgi:hypothetical protein